MSNVVEDRIINLKFNNKDFEKNAAQSMKTIDALEEKLTFKNVASKGVDAFKGLINAARQVPTALEQIADAGSLGMLSKIKASFTKNGDLFSPLMEMATGAFRKIGEEAYSLGKQITTSLTTQQIDSGWSKYADKTRSVQTIMNATGMSIDKVTEQLAKLNWYTDETSYAYTDMTSNIAKFTASGIDLKTAVTAMIGIGNAAGLAGASVQDASHAMTGFAKAMGTGFMNRQNWSWIETAHMDTQKLREVFVDAGIALGTLDKEARADAIKNFSSTLTEGKWLTRDVMLKALGAYGGLTNKVYKIYQSYGGEKTTSEILEEMGVSIEDLGLKSFKASQEAKTFADAIDSVKDAVSTGWMTTFDTIFGNYEEAKKLWTDFANWLYDMFAESGNYRNEMFEIFMGRRAIDEETDEYYTIGDQLLSGREYLLEAIYAFMDVITNYANAIKMAWDRVFGAWDYETIGAIAKQIHRVAQILQATLEKDLAMDPNKVSELEWIGNQNRNSFIVKFRLAMERFFQILKETVETVKMMGRTFYDALYEAFGDKNDRSHGFYVSGFYKWFNNVTLQIAKFIKTFRQVITENDRFKRILNGNFAVLKIFFNIISEAVDFIIQNGGGIIAILAEILASLGDFATSFDQSNLYDFIKDLFPLINTLAEKVLKGVLTVLGALTKVKDFLLDFFNALDARMGESGSFQMLINGFKHLGEAISRLLGFDKLGAFFASIGENADGADFLNTIVDATDNAIAALGGFFDLIAVGIEKVKKFADIVGAVASNIGTSISNIVGNIFGSKSTGTRGGMPGMEEDKQSIFDAIREKASSMLTNMFSDVNNEEVTRGATKYTGSIIEGIINALTNAVNNLDKIGIDFEKIKFLGYFVGFIVTLINLNKTLRTANDLIGNVTGIPEAITKAIENFGGIGKGIKDLLNEVKESLDEVIELEKIQTMAKVISTLSLVVMLLSTIPEEDLAKGVVYMGLIGAIFVAFNKAMGAASALANVSVMKNSVNITKSLLSGNTLSWNAGPLGWASVIIAIGSFVSSFVAAVNTISGADPNDVLMAAGLVIGLIGAMAVIIGLLGKLGAFFVQTGHNKTITDQVLSSGTTNHKETSNSLSGPSGKFFYGIAAAMLALAIGIKIVVNAIKILVDAFENNQTSSVVSALAVVFGLYGAVVLTTVGMMTMVERWAKNAAISDAKVKQLGKVMILIGVTIAIISASMGIVATAVAELAVVFALIKNPESAFMAMGTVSVVLLMTFGFIVMLMNSLKGLSTGQINRLGKSIVLVSAAIAIISGSVAIIIGTMIGMIAALTAENGILKLMGREEIVLMSIGVVAAVVAALMIFMYAMISQFRNTSDSKISLIGDVMIKMAETMIAMAGAVVIIAIAMAIVAKSGATIEQGLAIMGIIGVAAAALIASMFVVNKLGVKPNEIIALSQAFLSIAGAVLMMAAAVAIVSIIDINTVDTAFKNVLITLAAVTAAIVALALLAKFVPGTEVVISAFAATLMSIAIMFASVAGIAFGFATAVAVVTKSIKPLTEALPDFTAAFIGFLEGVKGHTLQLIGISIALSIFAGVIAAIVVGVVYLIIRFRSQIGAALTDTFTGIQHLFQQFGTWFSGLSTKTQLLIKSFALAISGGLVSATPKMYSQIEAGFMLLMERLGDSVGWIVEGLFALVVNIINGLADAIRNNASILAYSIYSALESVGEVLIDLLAPLFSSLLSPIFSWFTAGWSYIDAIRKWGARTGKNASAEEKKLADKELNDFFAEGFASHYSKEFDDWNTSITEGTKDLKENMRVGLTALADFYDVDPNKQLETLSEKNRKKALAEIEKGKKDLTKYAEDATSSVGDGAVSGLNKAKEKVFGWFDDNGINFNDVKSKLAGGASITDIASNFLGSDGTLNTDIFDSFIEVMSGEGFDTSNWESMVDTTGALNQNVSDLNTNTEEIIQIGDLLDTSYDDSAKACGSYTDSLKTAEDAEEAFGRDSDSMLRAIEAREDSFYSAGEKLATAVENGINNKWPTISLNITGKFKQLADDIREMLEMGDLNVTVGNVRVVATDENQNDIPMARENDPYNYIWDRDAGNNAMDGEPNYTRITPEYTGDYYSAQKHYGDMMANRVRDTINANKAAADEWAEFTGTKINDLYEEFHEYNTTFGSFKEDAQAFYKKDPNIYLDKDTLVGTFSEELKEPLGVHFVRLIQGRGW